MYDPGLALGFEVPEETVYVYRQKPSFSILATLHADTPINDFSNDEIHFCLNTRSLIWARMLSPRVAFTVVSNQSSSNMHE